MARNWRNLFGLRKTPAEDVRSGRSGIRFIGGVAVTEDAAMKVAAMYRGTMYIATQIAKLPWDIKDKNNEIIEDSVSTLLSLSPNPEMNSMTFRIWAIYTAIMSGNAYAEIERDMAGRPVALWPLNSRRVDPVRDPATGEMTYRVSGGSSAGEDVFLLPRNVFHLKNFHTKDGIVGLGLAEYASETLGISIGADRMASGLFANGGLPSGFLKHKGTMSDEAYKRLKDSWQEQFGGRKAGSVSLLEEDTTFEPINIDPQVLQFLESRKFGVIEIARFLGLPPTKLFDATASTYSNVENANLEVATDTLDAWACNLEMEADIKILNKRYGGRYTELDLYSVFRGDMTTRANYFSKMMQAGAITPNQIRRREGLPGYAGGDRYFIAVNNFTPADRLDEVIDAQIAPKTQSPPEPVKKESDPADDSPDLLAAAALKFLERK